MASFKVVCSLPGTSKVITSAEWQASALYSVAWLKKTSSLARRVTGLFSYLVVVDDSQAPLLLAGSLVLCMCNCFKHSRYLCANCTLVARSAVHCDSHPRVMKS
jgi:hypothetical protein